MKAFWFAPCALGFAAGALPLDFSGTWNISSKVGANPVSIQCTIVQKGDALSGTCKPAQFDPSEITGAVKRIERNLGLRRRIQWQSEPRRLRRDARH